MSRWRARLAGLCAVAAALALFGSPAAALQPANIQELTLPILALDLPISNLDESVTVRSDRVTLTADVLFAFNSARLSRKGRSRVAEAARDVRRRKPARLSVVGYTDSKGSATYNLGLSARRARTVAARLRSILSAAAPPIATRGRGEGNPVAPNTTPGGGDSPRGRARNRRVEVLFGR
jgi:outer membrane protein OmpA-like peptidoglycan-associated protein